MHATRNEPTQRLSIRSMISTIYAIYTRAFARKSNENGQKIHRKVIPLITTDPNISALEMDPCAFRVTAIVRVTD